MIENIILGSDSYKYSHYRQYPADTEYVRSYGYPRGGPFKNCLTFGALNYYAMELRRPVEWWMVDEAEEVIGEHMGPGIFNRKGWEHIMKAHGGVLPLWLRAVPEGYLVPVGNAMFTLENTDPVVPWLTNFMETRVYPWYPYTVSTLTFEVRQVILKWLRLNGTPADIDYKLQDFGYRGTTDSFDGAQAAIGGTAALVNQKGTDTVPALMFARRYYACKMAGLSINASEHSTITAWAEAGVGALDEKTEYAAYKNFLTQYPNGLAACVSDSRNIYEACEKLWGEMLHDEVLARDGVLIIRPDSGNPVEVVLKCLEILGRKFGVTRNATGHKLLNPKVRLIQGDGVDLQTIDMIYAVMDINGWSSDNVGFGMGGALLQKVNRDTMKWKIAASEIVRSGKAIGISKNPVGDPTKRSQAGNMTLYKTDGGLWVTAPRDLPADQRPGTDMMVTFYKDGIVPALDSLDTIRDRRATEELKLIAA